MKKIIISYINELYSMYVQSGIRIQKRKFGSEYVFYLGNMNVSMLQ